MCSSPNHLSFLSPSPAAPRGSEHPLAPSTLPKPWQDTPTAGGHRAKAMTAPPHQTARGHTPGHTILLHTAALLQGHRDPEPASGSPNVTQGLFHLLGSLSTHILQHSNICQPCQGAVGQLLADWVGSQRAPVPPRPFCKLPADPTKSCSSSLPRGVPSQGGLAAQGAEPESWSVMGEGAPWDFPSLWQAPDTHSHHPSSTLSAEGQGCPLQCC